MLPQPAAPRTAGSPTPLGSLDRALAPQPVTLHATLGSAEIDLQTLHSLRIGDVIRLDKHLDDAVNVAIAGAALPCEAHLVAPHGDVALRLGRPRAA